MGKYTIKINGIPLLCISKLKKTSLELMNELEVYYKEEDAVGIFISLLPRKFKEVRQHFENKFVYMVDANFGRLIHNKEIKKLNFEKYKAHLKCRRTLLEYIRTGLKGEEFIEFFSSWADEEGL